MILLIALLSLAPQTNIDPLDIVKKSVEANERNWKISRNYTFTEREEECELGSDGSRKKVESHTYEVTMLEGEPYYRMVQKDDQPLPPKEEKKEQEKLDKSIREREKETPEQRAKRLEKYDKEREESRKFLREVTDAFTFKLVGEELLEQRPMWVVEGTPRADFKGKLREAKAILPKIRGRLWIDQQDMVWARGELEVIDTISFGLALIRIHKGAILKFENTRVNEEVWLPKRELLHGSARLAYVKQIAGEEESTYRDYKKFAVESKITTGEEVKQP